MSKRVRQGLGWAVLGAALWGVAALVSVAVGPASIWLDLVVGLAAVAGLIAGLGGLFVAGYALIRGR